MALSLFAQYVAVVALFTLMVIVVALAIKSWFDQLTFCSNMMLQTENERLIRAQIKKEMSSDFDSHVNSTPGMNMYDLN